MLYVTKIDFEMTGGIVLTYYGDLSNGQHFAFSNGTVMILDADYAETFSKEFLEKSEGDAWEWEQQHKVAEFYSPESVPEEYRGIVSESFEALGKEIDSAFEEYAWEVHREQDLPADRRAGSLSGAHGVRREAPLRKAKRS